MSGIYDEWHVERPEPGVDPGDPSPPPAKCSACQEVVYYRVEAPVRARYSRTDERRRRPGARWCNRDGTRHACLTGSFLGARQPL